MKLFTNIFIILFVILFASCKKDHTCECTNSNGTYTAGVSEKSTKHQAKKTCEGLSSGDTNCKLK